MTVEHVSFASFYPKKKQTQTFSWNFRSRCDENGLHNRQTDTIDFLIDV